MNSSLLTNFMSFVAVIFIMVAVVSAQNDSEAVSNVTDDRSAPYNGIGLNFGVTIFVPGQVNDMIKDIYSDLKGNYIIYSEFGAPSMFMGESFKLKGIFYLNPYIALEPYGQAFWAGKYLTIVNIDRSAWVHLLCYSGGLNTWIRFSPDKLISFKTGAGAFGGYTHIEVTGDAGRVSLKGNGFGANILAGIDVTFRKAVINLDFTVPIGVLKYRDRTGNLLVDEDNQATNRVYSKYPEKVILSGFEFRPGVTFRF